jgi:hypothetical protein
LAKTDDVLLALSRTIPEFIQSVGSFQYKGKTYRLVDNFAASQYSARCERKMISV